MSSTMDCIVLLSSEHEHGERLTVWITRGMYAHCEEMYGVDVVGTRMVAKGLMQTQKPQHSICTAGGGEC